MTQRPEYGIVVDETIDAVFLRNVCQYEANKHRQRAAVATQGKALRVNTERADMFQKYADRFEHIRKEEVDRIKAGMGLSDVQQS